MQHISMDDSCLLDVTVLQSFVKKKVQLSISNNKHCEGWVQSVDPVSKSLILLKFEDDNVCEEATFVPGNNIKDIYIFDQVPSKEMSQIIDTIFSRQKVSYCKAEAEKRRESLCLWLSNNRIPYSVGDNLNIEVLQAATIVSPYTTSDIHCKNEVILDKIMKLVQQIPGNNTN